MSQDARTQLVNNCRTISTLLSENEKLIQKHGYKPPIKNYSLEKNEKINIASGYIRTSAEFWSKYHLNDICKSRATKDNISYALQLSDFYNYVINRFNIWGSIETLLFKQSYINILSIIEALILESCTNINSFCKLCTNIGRCANNICKKERENIKEAINKLYSLEILNINEKEKNRLIELFDLRNKVHIRLQQNNEFVDNIFNLQLHNEAIQFLQKIDEDLSTKATKYYKKCFGYEIRRGENNG